MSFYNPYIIPVDRLLDIHTPNKFLPALLDKGHFGLLTASHSFIFYQQEDFGDPVGRLDQPRGAC